ncbi:type VII secretion integral membrane protein EccD [Stackebrandtia albiflava]|uniref:Type VII secretion integral membrane protein EccD n=1 Tax=Stackebrandtia albiflava TaxID=406432 RepID=A0A562UXY4_9ACTN|nr:EsaB/YukD family protein [Stackebrandtia albiflava]TWJ10504.1 type VII secretion integral membrane protein EccD [Stackebrandtia albiflava]
MPGQYSSVTVVGPESTRDMALPSGVPVAELLPPLLNRGLAGRDGHAASWELTTVDGTRLHPARSLADAAVRDGDVLHLHDATDAVLPAAVEDVRDSVEDHVESAGHRWRAGTGRLYATIVAAVAVVAAAFVPGADLAVLLTGGLVCLSATVVSWWSADQAPLLSRLSLAAGALWAWRITHLASESIAPDGLVGELLRHTYGAWAAVALMLVSLVGTPLALPFTVGLAVVASIATPVVIAMQFGAPLTATVGIALVLTVFAIGLLPRAAMGLSGLFGVDRDIQAGEEVREPRLAAILARLDAVLTGAILAIATVATTAVLVLVSRGELWPGLLALGAGLALLSRSRVFDQTRHVAPFRVAGTLSLAICAAGWLLAGSVLLPWAPAVAVLAALVYVGLASVPRSTVANASAARIIRVVEILLVAGMIAICGQITGLYAAVGW